MMSVVRPELIRIWRLTFRYGGIGLMAGFVAVISVWSTARGECDRNHHPERQVATQQSRRIRAGEPLGNAHTQRQRGPRADSHLIGT